MARYDVTMGETLVCGIELPAFWTINGIARRCVGSKPLTKRMPSPALGLGNACTTGLRLRTRRFATVEAATRLARLRSDLATAAGSPSWLRKGAGPCSGLAMSGRMPLSCPGSTSKTPMTRAHARAY